VLEPGATHRTTYLPHGLWWDYWTNDRVEGGKDEVRQVDLEVLPLYVKAGTILPVGPVKQYAQEASSEPLTLRIYAGADGAMALYEDDGISFGYLKGQFSRLLCTWNDKERLLTLKADPSGGLPKRQAIVVQIAAEAGSKPLTIRDGTASINL
jgi:alpha-glucosidase (family GH31 glycosyl hydrolase)